jgi:protein transport protein SEC24
VGVNISIYLVYLLQFLGLRPRIDPEQVPSPIAVTEIDRQKWESKTFMTLPGTYAPLCTSDFIAVDQGTVSPY